MRASQYHQVVGIEGRPVTIKKPAAGLKTIIVKSGETVRGTTYFQAALINASDAYADHLIAQGVAIEAVKI